MSETPTPETIDLWACLELMGHVRCYGRVTEEEHFGQKLGRIEIPISETEYRTQFFGGASVYRISPCDEDTARKGAGYRRPQISQYVAGGEFEMRRYDAVDGYAEADARVDDRPDLADEEGDGERRNLPL